MEKITKEYKEKLINELRAKDSEYEKLCNEIDTVFNKLEMAVLQTIE